MAATLAQPTFGLQPPTNDDTMEISSDFGAMDGDIDIDFDGAGEQMQYEDDDQMVDDVKSDRGTNPDDDVMLDDVASNAGDREMHEAAPPQDADEDLLDFSDIEAEDASPPEQPTAQIVDQPSTVSHFTPPTLAPVEEPVKQVQSDVATKLLTEGAEVIDRTAQQEHEVPQPQSITLPEEEAQVLNQEEQSHDNSKHDSDDPVVHVSEEHASQHEEPAQPVVDGVAEEVTRSVEQAADNLDQTAEQHSDLPAEKLLHEQPAEAAEEANVEAHVAQTADQPAALTVDTDLSRAHEVEDEESRVRQPDSPTITGLHPTVVEYEGSEIYLFPSREPQVSEQYLLSNENLVTTSLGDLLQACRSVLGEALSEDEELVLGVEELDLYISEDSTPAFSTSFSELLEVYLQLHKHDGNTQPPPFHVTLTTKTRFTNRLTLITQAIAEGKGFSQLPFLQQYSFDETTGFPEEEPFEDDDDYQEEDQQDMEQQYANVDEQAAEEPQHQQLSEEQNHDNNDHTDNHVSEYEAAQHQEHTETAEQQEETAPADDDQDETQYYSPEGDDSYEETQDEVEGQDTHEDPTVAFVQNTTTDQNGENDNIDFGDDEDDDNSPTALAAPAEGFPHAVEPESSLADKAAQDVEEIHAPPEDEHFSDEEYQEEEAYQNEGAAAEDDQTGSAHVEPGNHIAQRESSVAAIATTDLAEDNSTNRGEHEALDEQESINEPGQSDLAHDVEQHDQVEYGNVVEESFTEDFVDQPDETLTTNGQSEHGSSHGADIETLSTLKSAKSVHDPDTIDFDDDEDELDDEPATPVQQIVETESSKLSPSIKRSYSERNETHEVDDDVEQALKKVRSS